MTDYLASFKNRTSETNSEQDDINRRLIELSALFEISQTLNSSLNLKAILDNILLVPMGRMMIGKGVILLRKTNSLFHIVTLKGLPFNLIGKEIELHDLPEGPFFLDQVEQEHSWTEIFENLKIDVVLPFVSKSDTIGIIGFSKKLTNQSFTEAEIEFLASLSNIAATSIENALVVDELKKVNKELDHKIQELNTLFDIGKEFNLTFEKEKVLKTLSYALMGQITINNFMIALKNGDSFKIDFVKGSQFKIIEGQACQQLCAKCHTLTTPYLNEDDSDFDQLLTDAGISVVVPMRLQDTNHGFIFLGEKLTRQPFKKSDFEFLQTLGNIAIIALENTRLFQETLEKQKLEEEMALAKNIQNRLLPKNIPQFENCVIHGLNISSKQVGGDYFDVVQIDDDHLALTVADVSGKGMPAALLMSNLQASLLTLLTDDYALDEIVFRINNVIYRNTNPEKYITFFIGILNLKTMEFKYVNAGHNPPYVHNKNKNLELSEGGLIIGMMPDVKYQTGQISLSGGDLLFMFTDGVTETMNNRDEEFEEKRVIEFLNTLDPAADPETINKNMLTAINEFAGDMPQIDDITMLTVKIV